MQYFVYKYIVNLRKRFIIIYKKTLLEARLRLIGISLFPKYIRTSTASVGNLSSKEILYRNFFKKSSHSRVSLCTIAHRVVRECEEYLQAKTFYTKAYASTISRARANAKSIWLQIFSLPKSASKLLRLSTASTFSLTPESTTVMPSF